MLILRKNTHECVGKKNWEKIDGFRIKNWLLASPEQDTFVFEPSIKEHIPNSKSAS